MSPSNFRDLVDQHYQSLYRYGYRLSGNSGDAEDLTQETFTKAFGRFHQLRDGSKARSWLFRILRNCYLLRYRQEKNRPTVSLQQLGETSTSSLAEERQPSSLDGSLGSFGSKDQGDFEETEVAPEDLQKALNLLDESFRTPLILYYFEEFSYREIAEQMDMPIGTVMSRLARGRAYLKDQLLARNHSSPHQ